MDDLIARRQQKRSANQRRGFTASPQPARPAAQPAIPKPPLAVARTPKAVAPARRPPRDPKALRAMARHHVVYEINMLMEMARGLRGERVSPAALQNALLESFLIHYRNLRDFFYPELCLGDRRDAASARDFVTNLARWRRRKGDWQDATGDERQRLNRQIAHLSWSRLKYSPRTWPTIRMTRRMAHLIRMFLEELPSTREPWFDEAERPEASEVAGARQV